MKIDDDARVHLWFDGILSFDPATATIELDVDGTRYPMTWVDTAVWDGEKEWRRTARTTGRFIGSARTPSGPDIQLTAGRHMAEPIVTSADGQVVPTAYPFPLDVN